MNPIVVIVPPFPWFPQMPIVWQECECELLLDEGQSQEMQARQAVKQAEREEAMRDDQ